MHRLGSTSSTAFAYPPLRSVSLEKPKDRGSIWRRLQVNHQMCRASNGAWPQKEAPSNSAPGCFGDPQLPSYCEGFAFRRTDASVVVSRASRGHRHLQRHPELWTLRSTEL